MERRIRLGFNGRICNDLIDDAVEGLVGGIARDCGLELVVKWVQVALAPSAQAIRQLKEPVVEERIDSDRHARERTRAALNARWTQRRREIAKKATCEATRWPQPGRMLINFNWQSLTPSSPFLMLARPFLSWNALHRVAVALCAG